MTANRSFSRGLLVTAFLIAWLPERAQAQLPTAGFRAPDLIERIDRGDWTWSLEFPRTQARLLIYGGALLAGIRSACTAHAPSPEEELFAASWIMADLMRDGSTMGENLDRSLRRYVDGARDSEAARADAAHLLTLYGCTGAATMRVVSNASRMVAGRRPAYGGEHLPTLLVNERVSPVEMRQITDRSLDTLLFNPRLLALVERDANDLNRLGFRALECHYDSDPTGPYYYVQYYWATGVASLVQLTGTLPQFVMQMQGRLRQAAGQPVRHPLLDFGPPRTECPPSPDPRLATKEIYASRPAPPAPRVPIEVGEPTIREQGVFITYEYGPVPEDFHPPVPELPDGKIVSVAMQKRQAGSLVRVSFELDAHSGSQNEPGWERINRARARGNPREYELYQEDRRAASASRGGARVLRCGYRQEGGDRFVTVRRYWYKTRPDAADPVRLRSRIPDHPMLVIHEPRSSCPLTRP